MNKPATPESQRSREQSAIDSGSDIDLDNPDEAVNYNPVPPRRSYMVEVIFVKGSRGVPMPFELGPE